MGKNWKKREAKWYERKKDKYNKNEKVKKVDIEGRRIQKINLTREGIRKKMCGKEKKTKKGEGDKEKKNRKDQSI